MVNVIRTTISLNPKLYKAAKIKATLLNCTFSDLVNEAVSLMLREDALDLGVFETRAAQPSRPFKDVLKSLKRNGLF